MNVEISDPSWNAIISLLSQRYPGITRQDVIKALDGGSQQEDKDKYVDMKEACAFLKCSRMTMNRLINSGKVKARHLGRKLLFDYGDLKGVLR